MDLRSMHTWWGVCALVVGLTCAGMAMAQGTNVASEFLEVEVTEEMAVADLLALLDQTVGEGASSGANPAVAHPLRRGVYVTAIPQGAHVLLRFEVDGGGTKPREAIAEVALSSALGHTFVAFAEAALRAAEAVFATLQFGSPWDLILRVESASGGTLQLKVEGDARAHFTLTWEIASPDRPIDRWTVPTAFPAEGEPSKGNREQLQATVHFPITLEDLGQFVQRAYGRDAPERFTDYPLIPHAWLHLTVTGEPTNRVVLVHFDAITTSGQRLVVAEAPASTDVGGRFVDETLARMQEMLDEEAAQAGSSRPWQTEFYYDDPATGLVIVSVKGEHGAFDVAYHLETPLQQVKPK
jgi:hypothetical protein